MGVDGISKADIFDEYFDDDKPQTNYDRIRNMSVDEMARFMYDLHCEECEWRGDECVEAKDCKETSCWCHRESGNNIYKQWLLAEVEE